MFGRIVKLIKKDLLLEWRQKYSFYGILLYLASSIFLINLLAQQPEPEVWNVLFWVILLFVSVNAVAKSFLQESKSRQLYYYSIFSAQEVILAKLIYNILLMLLMSLVAYAFFIVLIGNSLSPPFFGSAQFDESNKK